MNKFKQIKQNKVIVDMLRTVMICIRDQCSAYVQKLSSSDKIRRVIVKVDSARILAMVAAEQISA